MSETAEVVCGYPVHPACGLLPMMSQDALEALAEDIAAHGQRQPIYVYDGKLLDGRNRMQACEIAGVEPEISEWSGDDPVRWVLSLNFHRRHLSAPQKSVVGARAEALLLDRAEVAAEPTEVTPAPDEVEATESESKPVASAPTAREAAKAARHTAATLMNVSPRAIARGRKLIADAVPKLVRAVEQGEVSLSQATRVAELDRDKQEEVVAQGTQAVVNVAKRMQKERANRNPSLTRLMGELDTYCLQFSLTKDDAGTYRVTGKAEVGDEAVEIDVEDSMLRGVLNKAWALLQGG